MNFISLPGFQFIALKFLTTGNFCFSDFVHDALPTLGTTSAVRVMKDLVLSGEATETESNLWLTSISFISDPTKEMLSEVKVHIESIDLVYK